MATRLIVTPETEADLDSAYAWYEARRRGLGEEFLDCVDASVQVLLRWPLAFEVVHENYRRALVRRFPYAVFYEFADDALTVYAAFHTARDPQKWRDRLP
jgi:plasmid stabilization system protein ParE